MYREPDRPLFDRQELAFVKKISPILADGVRRAVWAAHTDIAADSTTVRRTRPPRNVNPASAIGMNGSISRRIFRSFVRPGTQDIVP